MKKLKVQELESRIAPSMSLFGLLGQLFGDVDGHEVWDVVDPNTGQADIAAGPIGDNAVAPRDISVDTNNIMLETSLVERLISAFSSGQ